MILGNPLLKGAILAAHLVVGKWAWLRFALGQVKSANGSTHTGWPLERSLEYISRVFKEYLQRSGLCPRTFEGKRVLEIGPGDTLGVALKFLAAGAAEVVSLDKFYSRRDPQKERRIYLALRETLTPPEKAAFDGAVDLSEGVRFNPERLRYIYGHGIEEAESVLGSTRFDLIVSRAVLEELPDPDTVFSVLDRLLKPGGEQIHRIDLRDYGTFSRFGYHALEFLTVPDAIYNVAGKYSRPNRLRIDYYRRKMQRLRYEASIVVTRVCGRETELAPFKASLESGADYSGEHLAQLRAMRPRLLPRFRGLPDEDLLASGIMLTARKPE